MYTKLNLTIICLVLLATACKQKLIEYENHTEQKNKKKLASPVVYTEAVSDSASEISWNEVPGADKYVILSYDGLPDDLKTGKHTIKEIGTTTGTEFIDKRPKQDEMSYGVKAFDNETDSYSNVAWTSISNYTDVPAKPESIVAIPLSYNKVKVTWKDMSDNERSFVIRKRATGSIYKSAGGIVPANVSEFIDSKGVKPATEYTYYVYARIFKRSPTDSSALMTTPPETVRAPTNFTASSSSPTRIDLSWIDNSDNETEFDIERYNDGVREITIMRPKNTQSYTDTGLTPNNTYEYVIFAKKPKPFPGLVSGKDSASATTQAAPVDSIVVRGIVKDAYLDAGTPNAKVKITHENAARAESTMTDAIGNYRIAFVSTPADTEKFIVDAGKNNWYSYKENLSTALTSGTLIDTLYIFEKFSETAPGPDNLRDGLKWMKYMHMPAWHTPNVTYIAHWRQQDLPLKTYINTNSTPVPTATTLQRTRDALVQIETELGKDMYIEVASLTLPGKEITYDSYTSNNIQQWAYDNNIPIHPFKGGVTLEVDGSGNAAFSQRLAAHEYEFVLTLGDTPSPFSNHLLSTSGGATSLSTFERRALNVLYNLPNTEQKRYLLYDPTMATPTMPQGFSSPENVKFDFKEDKK